MRGYLNNPDATTATIDADGWLHTGDIGRVDDEGRMFITDRLKADQVQGLPGRARRAGGASARIRPSGPPRWWAHPTRRPARSRPPSSSRAEVADDDLMAWVADRVAPHKRIRRVERVDAIPASPTGKICAASCGHSWRPRLRRRPGGGPNGRARCAAVALALEPAVQRPHPLEHDLRSGLGLLARGVLHGLELQRRRELRRVRELQRFQLRSVPAIAAGTTGTPVSSASRPSPWRGAELTGPGTSGLRVHHHDVSALEDGVRGLEGLIVAVPRRTGKPRRG